MRNLRTYSIVLQAVAIVAGIWVGIQLFEWGTGTTVSIGF
jgi:hypothetical protein